jgi:hypothetical protein
METALMWLLCPLAAGGSLPQGVPNYWQPLPGLFETAPPPVGVTAVLCLHITVL